MISTPCTFIEYFQDIPDPRIERKKLHKLIDIIVVLVCATLCGAKSFEEVELFGNERIEWLKQFLELKNGIPSHDTFGRASALLNPKDFQECFIKWVEALRLPKQNEVIAVDGKTARRSFDTKANRNAIHVVSAWAAENNLVLGQIKVNDKSNEITAIPELLNMLMVKGCIVTIDAMGCQKAIADNIVTNGADYVLAVKENQPSLYEQIRNRVDTVVVDGLKDVAHDTYSTEDKGHGREEHREYHVIDDITWLKNKEQWRSLSAIGAVHSIRKTKKAEQTEIRYYILSRKMSAKQFGQAVRSHWGIENKLHWNLDVSFREDDCRIRKSNAPTNMNVVRHVAINLLRQETSIKASIVRKQLKAALSTQYLERILGIVKF